MSKVKSPTEKKALSLEFDRRNMYGENDKSSRKNIPRSKQRTHQRERRVVGRILDSVALNPDPDDVLVAEGAAKVAARSQKLKGFKKKPDVRLADVLERKAQSKKKP